MMPHPIPVSDLVRCSVCPMQVYLSCSGAEEVTESFSYSIAKQITAHLCSSLDTTEIWDELRTVRPDVGDAEYAQP